MKWFLSLILALGLAAPAGAILPVDGNLYRVRFEAKPNSDEVCLFRFGEQAQKTNALKCMSPVATDGSPNEVEILLEPAPTADVEIVGLAYRRVAGAADLVSDLSNVEVLQVRPGAVRILPQ